MASHLLFRRPILSPFSICAAASTALIASQTLTRQRIHCCETAGATPLTTVSESLNSYSRDAKVPIFRNGRPNPAAYRQISAGSILGLAGGVVMSYFSKTLALLFGLAIFGAQYLANKGINIIPASKLQTYVKGIDLRSMIEDNAAFKLSFGITFALASLAEF